MLHLNRLDRCCTPETISVMTAAFDMICQSVSKAITDSDEIKKTLAPIILRHVDQGESSDSRRLPFANGQALTAAAG